MYAQLTAAPTTPRFLVPETVQTSAMDCGPAALKCLLEGFRIPASYGRLREACQTDVDGTSINTLEDVAQQLGLRAEQMMAPVDHLLLASAQLLPALVVTLLPNGFNHFVVVWRVHGPLVQLMDPATGRRWSTHRRFLAEVYRYTAPFSADGWRAWAATEGFVAPLQHRLSQLDIPQATVTTLLDAAIADVGWRGMATLDATTRMVNSVVQAGGAARGREASQLLEQFFNQAQRTDHDPLAIIPEPFWIVRPLPGAPPKEHREDELLLMQGSVLLKVFGVQESNPPPSSPLDAPTAVGNLPFTPGDDASAAAQTPASTLDSDRLAKESAHRRSDMLSAALSESVRRPEWELVQALRRDGLVTPTLLCAAALLAALSVTVEAALLRGLMILAADLGLGAWRLVLFGGLVLFVLLLLALEFPLAATALRMGRRLETRIRIAFLEKIPRLGDRYFHSRLISDMAQRAYGLHQLHSLPDLALRFVRLCAQLLLTTVGIIWLYPASAPIAFLAMLCAVAGALAIQPVQSERDMRVRTHAGALSRFYLDSLMGLLPIRTHSAERMVRREHEMLLVAWARESLALARIESLSLTIASLLGAGFVIWIVIGYVMGRGEASAVLLLLYWSLNVPILGQALAANARQYPLIRNNMARILEPLGAPEEEGGMEHGGDRGGAGAVALVLEGVTAQAGGHVILDGIDLTIQPGEHVAIVGESGAGKSSLVGLLLGWHRPAAGRVLVDGMPLEGATLHQLRRHTAWVDPAVQLWNRTLQENLRYGNVENHIHPEEHPIGLALEGADLYDVLERLPSGLQTRLGESGGLVSGGEGQRVRLGRALLRPDVRLVVLDEPFRGLDRAKRRQLLENARHHWQHTTLLCITHDIGETIDFGRVLVVEDGQIVEDGAPRALLAIPTSRYRALSAADEKVRQQQWSATTWRRLWLAEGQLHAGVAQAEARPGAGQRTEQRHTIQQIRGIGPVWAKRLREVGIHTLVELACVDAGQLKRQLTAVGHRPAANLDAWIQEARRLSGRGFQ